MAGEHGRRQWRSGTDDIRDWIRRKMAEYTVMAREDKTVECNGAVYGPQTKDGKK